MSSVCTNTSATLSLRLSIPAVVRVEKSLSNLSAIAAVVVLANEASSLNALASSSNVSSAPGAPMRFVIAVLTYSVSQS
nr:MAG: hypothetical protein CM15mV30_1510 [uncultured marine virus]